jgi:predicted AAA+ superfamily ATPase
MNEQSLKSDWQTLGLVFENLCMRDLSVYARALPDAARDPVHYYRDDNGLEADAIVEDAAGRWGAIEVKLGENKVEEAAGNLLRIREKLERNSLARIRGPEFLAVLVGLGERSYRRNDGVYVIPIGCLGR